MITLSAKINLLEGNNQGLSVREMEYPKNNISAELSSVLGYKAQGRNPFLLGSSKLGENAKFSNGEKYFIGKIGADAYGNFSTPYEIGISNPQKATITIVFDEYNNQFPKTIIVNGQTYENNSPIFVIPTDQTAERAIIEIYNWNTPNAPCRVQGIFINVDITINQRNLISLSSNIMSRTDTDLPSWGIISNSSMADFNDTTGEIRQYIEMGLLKKGLEVVVTLANTITGQSEIVGTFKTTEWDYNNDNRQVSVTYKDELVEWQDISISGINYDPRKPQHNSLAMIYNYLHEKTIENGYTIKSYEELNYETKTALNATVLMYPLLKEGTLWQQWTKLCEVAQLYIYIEKDGTINCIYKGD